MAKQKVGLHKQVSQIFDGVPLPKEFCSHERVKTLVSNRLNFLRLTSRESTPAPQFLTNLESRMTNIELRKDLALPDLRQHGTSRTGQSGEGQDKL